MQEITVSSFVQQLKPQMPPRVQLLSHLSPLGWEHINLNGDYVWRNNLKLGTGKYRPLRSVDIESYKKQS
ncbi:Tn3 family transposase [Escherichia coli]|uniref:Tn3 family transposase n=1 Tax=Escherichia coli TaxID=562 RepID=UPI003D9C7F39